MIVVISIRQFWNDFLDNDTWRLVIAGSGQKEYIKKINKLITDKSLNKKVIFLGHVENDLKTSLLSNALYFGLKNPSFANNLPRLYAPSTFKSGSSFSHFDESTYTVGSANSLMSPSFRAAEVNHTPGDLLLNCLNEIGWQINGLNGYLVTDVESIPEQTFEVLVFPNPVEDIVNVAFPLQTKPRSIKIELLDYQGNALQSIEINKR